MKLFCLLDRVSLTAFAWAEGNVIGSADRSEHTLQGFLLDPYFDVVFLVFPSVSIIALHPEGNLTLPFAYLCFEFDWLPFCFANGLAVGGQKT